MTVRRSFIALLLVAGTGTAWSGWSRSANAPIRIGVINSVTGGFTAYSDPVRDGLLLALDEINAAGGIRGSRVELVVEDDQGDPKLAAAAFEKLAKSGIPVVIGPITSATTNAVAPLANQYGVSMVSPLAHSPQLATAGPYVFMILPTTDVAAREEAALVMKRFNPKRVAFLGDSRSLAAAANAVWKEQLTAAGVEIVADESFTEDDRDFTAQLTKVRDGNVDLVLYPAYYKYETVEIVKQSRKLGIDVPLVGFGQVCEEAMENLANSGHQNLFFVEEAFGRQLKESGNKFVASFTQRYGIRAAMEAAAGHAALVMVKDAIERGGYKAKDIRNALRSGQVNTAIGPVKYGKGGANTAAQFALSTLPQRMGAAIAQ